jgi:hypothetical protein
MKEDIIRMAREACDADKVDAWHNGFWTLTQEELEKFAALVAEEVRGQTIESEKRGWLHAIDKMVAAEREECAKAAETHVLHELADTDDWPDAIATAIRARGEMK